MYVSLLDNITLYMIRFKTVYTIHDYLFCQVPS